MISDDRDREATLADRSRRRVYNAVSGATGPVGVADLVALCGIHPNTVRLHLERLTRAGLVKRVPAEAQKPGRPPHRYVATAGDPRTEKVAYRRLAGLLAAALRQGCSARAIGRQRAARPPVAASEDPVAALANVMAADGFRPVVESSGADSRRRTQIVLRACPFADLAAEEPATVCQLHLGMAEGAAEAIGGVAVERLVVGDPFEAGCRLVVRRGSKR